MRADLSPKETGVLFAGAIGVGLAAGLLAVAFEAALGRGQVCESVSLRKSEVSPSLGANSHFHRPDPALEAS